MKTQIAAQTRYCGAASRATVKVLTGDILTPFVTQTLLLRLRRVIVVSPWLGGGDGHAAEQLAQLLAHAQRHGATFELLTRPSQWEANTELLGEIDGYERGRVSVDDTLHAKLLYCESRQGTALALIGSANFTDNSRNLMEIGVLIAGFGGSRLSRKLRRISHDLSRPTSKRTANGIV